MNPGTDQPHPITDAALAEYTALREEILNRSRIQFLAITGSLIAAGTVFGSIATNPEQFKALILVVPWLLTVFGIVWLDQAHGIHVIACYVREELEQRVFAGTSRRSAPRWESWLQERRVGSRLLDSVHLAIPFVYFVVPSVAALSYYALWLAPLTEMTKMLEIAFLLVLYGSIAFIFLVQWRAVFFTAELYHDPRTDAPSRRDAHAAISRKKRRR